MYRAADIALRHLCGTAHHSDKVSQYVSGIYTQQLKEAGLQASTGRTGDSYGSAMAESNAEVELATLTWMDWYNNRRLLERLWHIPPAEAEKAYYASIGNDELAA